MLASQSVEGVAQAEYLESARSCPLRAQRATVAEPDLLLKSPASSTGHMACRSLAKTLTSRLTAPQMSCPESVADRSGLSSARQASSTALGCRPLEARGFVEMGEARRPKVQNRFARPFSELGAKSVQHGPPTEAREGR